MVSRYARQRRREAATAVVTCRQSLVSAVDNNKTFVESRHLTSCRHVGPCGGIRCRHHHHHHHHHLTTSSYATPSITAKRTLIPGTRYFSTGGTNDEDKNTDNVDNSTQNQSQQQSSSSPIVQVTSNKDTISLEIPGTKTGKGRQMAIVFTCTVCETRSAKQFTEHAYLHGVVMVRCPGCQNLHLIADRLGWFDDTDGQQFDLTTLEQMTGQKVKRIGSGNNGEEENAVWEFSLEDLIGKEKMQQILDQQQRQEEQEQTEYKEEKKS